MGLGVDKHRELTSFTVHFQTYLTSLRELTDRISGKDGISCGAVKSRSGSIDGGDPEQILGALNESANHK